MDPADLPIGQPVSIRWDGSWHPGTVQRLAPNGALWCVSPAFRGLKLMRSGEWRNVVAKEGGA